MAFGDRDSCATYMLDMVVAPRCMMDSAELDWLSHVAVPVLAVCADKVVAMNPMAAALFGCARDALPVDLAALCGDAGACIASLFQSEGQETPDTVRVTCTIAGAPRHLTVGARMVAPGGAGSGSLWALTFIEVGEPPNSADTAPSDADRASAASLEGTDAASGNGWIKMLPAILDRLPVALLIEDENNLGVFVNRGFTDIFEYGLDEIARIEDWWVKLYPDPIVRENAEREWSEKLANAAAGDGTISTSEFQVHCGGGADKMVQSHSFRIGDYRVHSYVDVSQRHQITVDLQLLADTDPLTGILNRRSFFHRAATLMRADRPLAALLFDVDHFKLVNDRLGHAFGDQVLVEIAVRCRSVLGPADVLARVGGEEFAVLLPRHDEAHAAATAERLRNAMASAPVTGLLGSQSITISVGGACARQGEFSIDELLQRADNALYAAKRAGRDCVRFDPGMPLDAAL